MKGSRCSEVWSSGWTGLNWSGFSMGCSYWPSCVCVLPVKLRCLLQTSTTSTFPPLGGTKTLTSLFLSGSINTVRNSSLVCLTAISLNTPSRVNVTHSHSEGPTLFGNQTRSCVPLKVTSATTPCVLTQTCVFWRGWGCLTSPLCLLN